MLCHGLLAHQMLGAIMELFEYISAGSHPHCRWGCSTIALSLSAYLPEVDILYHKACGA